MLTFTKIAVTCKAGQLYCQTNKRTISGAPGQNVTNILHLVRQDFKFCTQSVFKHSQQLC